MTQTERDIIAHIGHPLFDRFVEALAVIGWEVDPDGEFDFMSLFDPEHYFVGFMPDTHKGAKVLHFNERVGGNYAGEYCVYPDGRVLDVENGIVVEGDDARPPTKEEAEDAGMELP